MNETEEKLWLETFRVSFATFCDARRAAEDARVAVCRLREDHREAAR